MDFEQQQNHNNNGVVAEEVDFEIWPVEHPMEPPDEDRPVKCPMPESSVINDEGKREKRLAESMRKRAGESAESKPGKEEAGAVVAQRPARAVRKRHHTLTGGDDRVMVPLTRMPPPPPPPPLPAPNLTVFQMLQQLDKFES
ncbi:hypothetical protein TIFTF001_007555 [Ficus carica]|uniref:Uncharacterized protein n=1 Tax=Ficus carica TaxID=3494 RepID=A0AA88CX82_FICCA|nr:hypothetical protein TIFTF001_007555 [Ficus carica]